ncbi:hypothetical protein [Chitinophaga rhizophila]|uniref:Uncharacterized protein n=1 Tax=Chitinophaga rhizophila TaxID=2866212 RepID=A0ABS7G7W5_9BACT|nr:hypothetical protein [Chitinophaga rhizophila]MBW8683738.1 hypothetical protein [Chitinophaga rhizophila]
MNTNTGAIKAANLLTESNLSGSGTLLYDLRHLTLAFVHHFSNSITIFDTAFCLLPTVHTIDTFTRYRANYLAHNQSAGNSILYKPGGNWMMINYLSQVYEGKIYVNSLVKADNETLIKNKHNTVIDVYDLLSGNYIESFYIPLRNGEALNSFNVSGKRLIVTDLTSVSIYQMP